MPTYTYTGDEGRYYPSLGLAPEPGQDYELDRNPADGRWTPDDPEPEPEPDRVVQVDEPMSEAAVDVLREQLSKAPDNSPDAPTTVPAGARAAAKRKGS